MDIISYLLGKNSGGGTPAVLQEKTVYPSTTQQVVTPDEGYNGLSQVVAEPMKLAETEVIPDTRSIVIGAPYGYDALGEVTVDAVNSSIDPNIVANNIRKDVTILGVTGTYGAAVVPPEAGTLTGILVGTLPTKTTYIEGDALDLTGCVILGNYSNGYQYDVTAECTFTCNDPVTFNDTKIVVSLQGYTLDIPITVNGVPVQAPAETKGLWHFNNSTDKNEVNGKGTNTTGLVNPISQTSTGGVFGTVGCINTSNLWLSYNNTLGFTTYQQGTAASTDFTIEFWFKATSTNNNTYAALLNISRASNVTTDVGVKTTGSGSASQITLYGGSYWMKNATTTPLSFDRTKYHHFAFVNNHDTRKIYIDGHLLSTSTDTSGLNEVAMGYISFKQYSSSYDGVDEILVTESAKYLADFEPPHAEYYLPS